MASRTRLLVGTKKGAFILDSEAGRRDWSLRGPLCEGWPIHDLITDPDSGAILAGGGSPWYGPAVWRSDDGGATWSHSSSGMSYGDGKPDVVTVWSLATTP
ncbi:MAG: exo-alpha-sialidase, partial [Chloroflexi bacterium]|nr:exo-alpha-sialidase [Chloroflexota bacterium]